MRLVLGLALCLALAPVESRAQERTAKNTFYVELLGNGLVYSVNYERFVGNDVAFRLGAGYISANDSGFYGSLFALPVTASYLGVRSGNHALELGGGAVVASYSGGKVKVIDSDTGVAGTAIVGYRYAPTSGGFTFRVAFTPVFGAGGFLPWGGAAVGMLF